MTATTSKQQVASPVVTATASTTSSNESFIDENFIEHMRKIVKDFLAIHCYDTALFWADKINTLVAGSLKDFYMFLQCLYFCGQYQRALTLIKQDNLHKRNLLFRYMAAKCHFVCKEYEMALDVLDCEENGILNKTLDESNVFSEHNENIASFSLNGRNVESAIFLLKGQIHEALGCSDAAIDCYKNSLHADVYCYQAYHALLSNHMLTPKDENNLLQSLPIKTQCKDKEAEFLKYAYAVKLCHPNKQCITYEQNPQSQQLFKDNLDIQTSKAERLYYNGDFDGAYLICRRVLEKDQFHKLCIPLYVSTLVHLNKVTQLFEIAHILVKQYPQDAASWFAVGCYYFLIGNMDPARKFFLKATCLNRSFSPAWLALGHSFAHESEHDQATQAYFTAAQIMKGSILPHLYIGLEYTLSNNLKLAERFYQQALSIEWDDPFVLHELGVIWFKAQNYPNAEKSMRRALERVKNMSNRNSFKEWEPLFNNLGHVCRKLKKYNDSLEYHRKALSLNPTNSSTWAAIGLTCIFLNKFDEAIEYFHQALWHKKQDLVAKKLLDKCLNLNKDHASVTASDEFQIDIMDIIGHRSISKSHNTSMNTTAKTGGAGGTADYTMSDTATNKSMNTELDNESAMELVAADESDNALLT